MAAKLKVFVTSDGLTDFVVAATSKPKALAAWGSHQDLFKTGIAHETDDPVLVKAATAQPGEVLRKPAGSLAKLAKLKPAKAKRPSKATLKRVVDLEAQVAILAAEHARVRRALEKKQTQLAKQIADMEAAQAQERARLEAKLSAAKRALA